MKTEDIYCKFCGGKAFLVSNSSTDNYYRCPICGASRPATKNGVILKQYPWRTPRQLMLAELAHTYIDELCNTAEERKVLYKELAKAIKVPLNKCHFKTMSVKQMEKAVVVLKNWIKNHKNFRRST